MKKQVRMKGGLGRLAAVSAVWLSVVVASASISAQGQGRGQGQGAGVVKATQGGKEVRGRVALGEGSMGERIKERRARLAEGRDDEGRAEARGRGSAEAREGRGVGRGVKGAGGEGVGGEGVRGAQPDGAEKKTCADPRVVRRVEMQRGKEGVKHLERLSRLDRLSALGRQRAEGGDRFLGRVGELRIKEMERHERVLRRLGEACPTGAGSGPKPVLELRPELFKG